MDRPLTPPISTACDRCDPTIMMAITITLLADSLSPRPPTPFAKSDADECFSPIIDPEHQCGRPPADDGDNHPWTVTNFGVLPALARHGGRDPIFWADASSIMDCFLSPHVFRLYNGAATPNLSHEFSSLFFNWCFLFRRAP